MPADPQYICLKDRCSELCELLLEIILIGQVSLKTFPLSSQTFIRTQGECTICIKHCSKFCPQEVIAFNMCKVSAAWYVGYPYLMTIIFIIDLLKILFIYLAKLDLHCCAQAPPAAVRGGCSLTEVLRPLAAVASPVAEHGL